MNNTTYKPLLNSITLAIFVCFSATSLADGFRLQDANTQKVEKEKWLCKYCPDNTKSVAKISVNLSNNSEDNGHFSTITEEQKDGTYAHLDAELSQRSQDTHYQVQAKGLGKDNSYAHLSATKLNSYKISLNYQTLNQFGHAQGLTPFTNAGNASLLLPSDWQRVATTAEMSNQQFSEFDQKIERQNWQLAAETNFTNNWQGYIDYQYQDKQGLRTTSGNILTKTVILPEGINQQHSQLDAGSYYQYDDVTLLVNYYHNDFSNKRSVVNWNSPYAVVFGGANNGQLSSSPDNEFDQISIFGNYRDNSLTLQARLIYGQLSQTDDFLSYSSNNLLEADSLPTTHLDGQINTFSTHLKALYRTDNKWRLTANYHFQDRDNKTQRNSYQHILTDSAILPDLITNNPYSFKKEKLTLEAQYRFAIQSHLSMGWQLKQQERDFQDRKNTENEKFWFKVSTHFAPFNKVYVELSKQFRDGSSYNRIDKTSPIDSTLPIQMKVQKYYQADRQREQAKGHLSLNPFSSSLNSILMNTEVAIEAYFSHDLYQHTDIGLIESKRTGVDLSVSTQLSKHVSLAVYAHNQWQENISQGSYLHNDVDWLSNQDDKSDSVGINLAAEKLADGKLTLAADYTYSYASGITQVNSLSLNSSDNHKELVINSHHLNIYADYDYSNQVDLHLGLLYQKFSENDWRSEYDIDRIINVLGNGLSNYDYDAYRLTAGVTYQF
jgi:MtrB/PioB family decaheme-associated outer membrane protein